MGSFKPNEGNGDNNLSLEKYIELLKDYKEKAIKVFQMGDSKSYSNYVLSALEYAINVAQGKSASNEEKATVLRSAEELTKSALSFHNKFAQIRDNIEQKESKESVETHEKGGPGLNN